MRSMLALHRACSGQFVCAMSCYALHAGAGSFVPCPAVPWKFLTDRLCPVFICRTSSCQLLRRALPCCCRLCLHCLALPRVLLPVPLASFLASRAWSCQPVHAVLLKLMPARPCRALLRHACSYGLLRAMSHCAERAGARRGGHVFLCHACSCQLVARAMSC